MSEKVRVSDAIAVRAASVASPDETKTKGVLLVMFAENEPQASLLLVPEKARAIAEKILSQVEELETGEPSYSVRQIKERRG